jgi:type VI secretion system secreted protein Hcp
MAFDIFLSLAGIKGESRDSAFQGTTELQSINWGFSLSGSISQGFGKPDSDEIVVSKFVDSTSPLLIKALNSAAPIGTGKISFRKAGSAATSNIFLVVDLVDVVVRRVTVQSMGGDELPSEQVSLEFREGTWTYRVQNADGSYSDASSFTWKAAAMV